MTPNDMFSQFVKSLSQRDNEAAVVVYRRFVNRLRQLTRCHLGTRVRQRIDPEDVVQSVFKSFFHRYQQGEFELESWNSLWGLLALMAIRKCKTRIRALLAECRDIRREVSPGDSHAQPLLQRNEPTTEEVVLYQDLIDWILREAQPEHKLIIRLLLAGDNQLEIAQAVGVSPRTVRRTIRIIREWLFHKLALPNSPNNQEAG